MYSLQKKIQYTLIKKDTAVICALITAMHVLLAPVCFYFNYDLLSRYHIYAATLYAIMIMLSKAIPPLFLFTMCDLETLSYPFVITFTVGNDIGSYILPITLLAYLFMILASSEKTKYSTIIPASITIISVFLFYSLDYNFAESTKTISKTFYLLHYTLYSVTSFFTIIFICYVIQKKLFRFKNKTRIKNAYLNYSATHDSLTKILNRRKVTELINDYSTNPEYVNTNFATAIFDIDGFKQINDSYGHNCGDIILRTLSEVITRTLPEHTVFARWGGEEFLILFAGNTENAKSILEDIRARIQEYSFRYSNKAIKITITIGLSDTDKSYNFSKMLIQADKNLIKGKQNGKNQVVTSDMQEVNNEA